MDMCSPKLHLRLRH